MKTYIHVNQHVIKSNLKHGENKPAITVKTSKSNVYCHKAIVKGEVEVIQSTTDKPLLSCGARIVMVTHDPVAASFSDQVIFLADGQVVGDLEDPTADRVLDQMRSIGN